MIPDKPYHDRSFLYHAYITRGQTRQELADMFGISKDTISFWLYELDITLPGPRKYYTFKGRAYVY